MAQSRSEHDGVVLTAWLAGIAYPIGVMAFCGVLLSRARRAIIDEKPTPLSRALEFLYKEYLPEFFWWEIMEMFRRFVLVGILVMFRPGSLEPLAQPLEDHLEAEARPSATTGLEALRWGQPCAQRERRQLWSRRKRQQPRPKS